MQNKQAQANKQTKNEMFLNMKNLWENDMKDDNTNKKTVKIYIPRKQNSSFA